VSDNLKYRNIKGLKITDLITKMKEVLTKLFIKRFKKARQRKGISVINSCKECRSV
jgi:ribosomal protein L29